MNKNTQLTWGQPWNFLFTKNLDPQERKAAMADLGSKLYKYIEKALGSKERFSLQVKWSKSVDNSNLYQLDANLIVTQEGVVAWEKNKFETKGRANKGKLATKETTNAIVTGISGDLGIFSLAGSKPPPRPPPPPPRTADIISDDAPYEYFSNQFSLSHVLNFSLDGKMTQFGQSLSQTIH